MPAIQTEEELKTRAEQTLRERGIMPAPVKRLQVEMGEDATGDRAVWVWAILDDADFVRTNRLELRGTIRDAVQTIVGEPVWVYVRFRATSEI